MLGGFLTAIGRLGSTLAVIVVSIVTGAYRWFDNLLTRGDVLAVPIAKVPRGDSDEKEHCSRQGQVTRA
jgi:hypothetical protein